MDGPIDWWWEMNLLDVCVQAGFCQIWSQIVKVCLNISFIILQLNLLPYSVKQGDVTLIASAIAVKKKIKGQLTIIIC